MKQADGQWTKDVELREMTTFEDDILLDRAADPKTGKFKVKPSERITLVLSRCTEAIGNVRRPDGKTGEDLPLFFVPYWENAFLADMATALVRLRQISVAEGERYVFKQECPFCDDGKEHTFSVDLRELPVTDMDTSTMRDDGTCVYTLPFSGHTVHWRHPMVSQQEAYAEAQSGRTSTPRSDGLRLRLVSINGQPVTPKLIGSMTKKDAAALDAHVEKMDFGMDIVLESKCPTCARDFKRALPIGEPSFFFPKTDSLVWKTASSC